MIHSSFYKRPLTIATLLTTAILGMFSVMHIVDQRRLVKAASHSKVQHVYVTDDGKWVPLQVGERMQLDLPGNGWRTSLSEKGALRFLGNNSYLAVRGNVLDVESHKDCKEEQPCRFKVTVLILVPPTTSTPLKDITYSSPEGYDPIDHP